MMELQNDHNVYILGAGFSHDGGLPTLPEFLTKMRDCRPWLVDHGRTTEADAVKAVLEFRLNAASAAYWVNLDLENIEELFSLASASTGNLSRDIQLAIAATLDYCASTSKRPTGTITIDNLACGGCLGWIPAPEVGQKYATVGRYEHHVAKLLGLFRDGGIQGQNTFVTFNYDTLLEDALHKIRIPFNYGFRGKSVAYDKSAKASKNQAGMKVLKLHGSANWARGKRKGRNFTVFGNYNDVRGALLVPELVPPTWKKILQGQLADVWNSAVSSLRTATRVIIIGFSIPPNDMHFKYLLAAGLQQNISLREILFVNPEAEVIEQRANNLLRKEYIGKSRIRFESSRLEDFVNLGGSLFKIGRAIKDDARIQFG
jgi:hypothetical protein